MEDERRSLIRKGLHVRVVVRKQFFRTRNRVKKAEVCPMTQELDRKSVATDESSSEPRPQNY